MGPERPKRKSMALEELEISQRRKVVTQQYPPLLLSSLAHQHFFAFAPFVINHRNIGFAGDTNATIHLRKKSLARCAMN
jgi:hypothetical protein